MGGSGSGGLRRALGWVGGTGGMRGSEGMGRGALGRLREGLERERECWEGSGGRSGELRAGGAWARVALQGG